MRSLKSNHYICIMVFTLCLLTCCKKVVNDPNTTTKEISGPFTAKVDGTKFPTTNAGATYTISMKMLQISGVTKDNRETIILTLTRILDPNITGWGDWKAQTFDLTSPIPNGVGSYITAVQYNKYNDNIPGYEMWQNDKSKNPQIGRIIITEIKDKHIKGTFFFESYKFNGSYDHKNSKEIKEGTFDLDVTIK